MDILQKRELEADSFDWKSLGVSAWKALDVMQEHDPVALKNAYQQLFEAIVVGNLDSKGVRSLEFVIRDGTAPAVFVTAEENSSSDVRMG